MRAQVRRLRWRFYRKTGGPRGWGNRCPDYGPGCPLCERYRFLDEFGRFPMKDDEPELAARTDEARRLLSLSEEVSVPWKTLKLFSDIAEARHPEVAPESSL